MLDAHPGNHTVGAGAERDHWQRADLNHWQPGSLEFLADRCTATIAGSSSGHEENGPNIGLMQLLGDLGPHPLRFGDRRLVADSCVVGVVQ